MTSQPLPTPHECGHLTHLLRGSTRYGWDSEEDRWDQCDTRRPVRRKAVAVATRPEPERDPFLSAAEIAARLMVSKMTIYRLIAAGSITAVQVGRSYRVRESKLAEYLASAEVDAS